MIEILKFGAAWCGPCQAMSRELTRCRESFQLTEIDVEENLEMATDYRIRSLPTLVMKKDGVEVSRLYGKQPALRVDQMIKTFS